MCILYPILFTSIPPKLQFVIGLLSASLGLCLMSDSRKLLGLPDSEAIIIVGMTIVGTGNIFAFIPTTPEIINKITIRYKIVEGVDDDLVAKMNDSVSALTGVFYNLGGMLAPLIGAGLYDLLGYEITMNIFSVFILSNAFIFFFFNAGLNVFKDFRK